MECRECRKKMPEYLGDSLSKAESGQLSEHLHQCSHCREEMEAFAELDLVIESADIDIPEIDLKDSIMVQVRAGHRAAGTTPIQGRGPLPSGSRRTASLMRDLVVAAAAAMIIFWFSSPVFAENGFPGYTNEVVKVSNTVGGVFQRYMDFSTSAWDSLSHPGKLIPNQKGDEKL